MSEAPDDGDRQPGRLALHEVGRRGDLVGDRRDRRLEAATAGIRRAAEVVEHVKPSRPDRHVRLP